MKTIVITLQILRFKQNCHGLRQSWTSSKSIMQLTEKFPPNSTIFIEKKWVENRLWGKSVFLWGKKNVSLGYNPTWVPGSSLTGCSSASTWAEASAKKIWVNIQQQENVGIHDSKIFAQLVKQKNCPVSDSPFVSWAWSVISIINLYSIVLDIDLTFIKRRFPI